MKKVMLFIKKPFPLMCLLPLNVQTRGEGLSVVGIVILADC